MSFLDALFGSNEVKMSDQAKAYQVGGPDYSQAWQQGTGNDAAMRAQQQAYLGRLQEMAAGKGPAADLARAQFAQNQNQASAAVASQIASARGLNPAAAIRMASQQGAAMGQAGVANAAALRAQQQLAATGQLGSALGQFRGQDQAMAGMGLQGNLGQEGLKLNAYNSAQNLNTQMGLAKVQADQAALGNVAGLMSGVGQMATGYGLFGRKARGGEVLDSEANDTVPTLLSPGERVIPRSLAADPEKSADFIEMLNDVAAGRKPKKRLSREAVIKALAAKTSEFQRRLEFLESKLGGAQ